MYPKYKINPCIVLSRPSNDRLFVDNDHNRSPSPLSFLLSHDQVQWTPPLFLVMGAMRESFNKKKTKKRQSYIFLYF